MTASQDKTADRRNPDDAPVGWVRPERYAEVVDKAMAYRRQLLDNGIMPDLERYRLPRGESSNEPR